MGTSTDKYSVRWKDFESSVSGLFSELRKDSDFFDVTLVTSDSGNRVLQAHKVILSACSDFFKQILKQQTRMQMHHTPLAIYLRGVRYDDLLAVLDFMYQGEATISPEEVNSFCAAAEELQIKGFIDKIQPEPARLLKSVEAPIPSAVGTKGSGPPPKRARQSSPTPSQMPGTSATSVSKVNDVLQQTTELDIKIEPEMLTLVDDDDDDVPVSSGQQSSNDFCEDNNRIQEKQTEEDQVGEGTLEDFMTFKEMMVTEADDNEPEVNNLKSSLWDPNKDLETQIDNLLFYELEEDAWVCQACGKHGKRRDTMKRHVENQHLLRVLRCKLCQCLQKHQDGFNRHMKMRHGIVGKKETEKYKDDLQWKHKSSQIQ